MDAERSTSAPVEAPRCSFALYEAGSAVDDGILTCHIAGQIAGIKEDGAGDLSAPARAAHGALRVIGLQERLRFKQGLSRHLRLKQAGTDTVSGNIVAAVRSG